MADEANGNEIETVNGNGINGDHDSHDEEPVDEIAKLKARISAEIPDDVIMASEDKDEIIVVDTRSTDEVETVEVEQTETGASETDHSNEENVEVPEETTEETVEEKVEDDEMSQDTESNRDSFIEHDIETESNRESFIQIPEDSDSHDSPIHVVQQRAEEEEEQQNSVMTESMATDENENPDPDVEVIAEQTDDIPEDKNEEVVQEEIEIESPTVDNQEVVESQSRPESFIQIEQSDDVQSPVPAEEPEQEQESQSPEQESQSPEVSLEDESPEPEVSIGAEVLSPEPEIDLEEPEEIEIESPICHDAEPVERPSKPIPPLEEPEILQTPEPGQFLATPEPDMVLQTPEPDQILDSVESPLPTEEPEEPSVEEVPQELSPQEEQPVSPQEEEPHELTAEEEAERKRHSQYIDFDHDTAQDQVETVTTSHKFEIRSSREGSLDEEDDVQADDKIEDDRDALPSLKNIKSRFENVDDNRPQADRPAPGKLKSTWNADMARNKEVSPSPPRDPDIVREEKSKEQVPVTSGGIGSIKQQYMASVQKPGAPSGPPKPIQIPRQEFNRNEPSPSPQRDPNVVRSEDVLDEGQFMPAPQTTRGLVARFKQMEVESSGQASPTRRAPMPAGNVHAQRKQAGYTPEPRVDLLEQERQIPDSGEFENNPQIRDDVVTEWDELPEQELPEVGAAKSRINLFRQKERETAQKPPPSFGEMYAPGGTVLVNGDQKRVISDRKSNQPDVVRHEDNSPEQLPPQDLTKSMLSKFRQLEADAQSKKSQEWVSPRRETPTKRAPPPRENGTSNGNGDIDRPLFNPANPEGGEFENQPVDLPDVVRESDPFDENELPEVGVTRNLLAKFQSMQT